MRIRMSDIRFIKRNLSQLIYLLEKKKKKKKKKGMKRQMNMHVMMRLPI